MAVSRIERFILKSVVYGSLVFNPQALDPEIESEESSRMIRARFNQLSLEEKKPFYSYFRAKPSFPLQFYRKSNTEGKGLRCYKFHYEYDRPDRKTEARRLILSGFDLTKLKGEYYTFAQLHELRKAHESGLDITPLLDNRYSRFQLKILVPALRRGYDMSQFMDPSIPAREMAAMYYDIVEQNMLHKLELNGIEKEFEALDLLQKPRKPELDQTIERAAEKEAEISSAKVIDFAEIQKKSTLVK